MLSKTLHYNSQFTIHYNNNFLRLNNECYETYVIVLQLTEPLLLVLNVLSTTYKKINTGPV